MIANDYLVSDTEHGLTARPKSLDEELAGYRSTSTDITALSTELKLLSENPEEYWFAMGSRLFKIVNERLYKIAGYRTFDEYCRTAIGYSRQHVYKLIKMAQFIEQQLQLALTEEQRTFVSRALRIGFTKLYILHSLRQDLIFKLFKEGVMIPPSRRFKGGLLSLEAASVSQLKRALTGRSAEGSAIKATALIIEPDLDKASLIKRALNNAHIRSLMARNLDEARTSICESYDYIVMRAEIASGTMNIGNMQKQSVITVQESDPVAAVSK